MLESERKGLENILKIKNWEQLLQTRWNLLYSWRRAFCFWGKVTAKFSFLNNFNYSNIFSENRKQTITFDILGNKNSIKNSPDVRWLRRMLLRADICNYRKPHDSQKDILENNIKRFK